MAKKVTTKKKKPVLDWRPKQQPLTHEKMKRFLYGLMRLGNVSEACRFAGANRTAIYQRMARDAEFARFFEEARRIGAANLEDVAYDRAVNGWEEPVFYLGDECGAKQKFSPALMIFLLKAHDPDKYRERFDIEHGAKGGGPLSLEVIMHPKAVAEASM